MSFQVTTMRDQHEPQDIWVADRRLWLTADQSEAVEDGDPKSAFLLVAPGQSMSRALAEELGVIPEPVPEATTEPEVDEEVKEAVKSEDKQLAKPEDKQRAKPATKSRKRAKKKTSKRARSR